MSTDPNQFRIDGLTSLSDRLRACWKRLDPTDAAIDPVAMMQASALLAEAAAAIEATVQKPMGAFKRGDIVMLRPTRDLYQRDWLRLVEWATQIEKDHGISIILLPYLMEVVGPKRLDAETT
jgi:hypothetical protein